MMRCKMMLLNQQRSVQINPNLKEKISVFTIDKQPTFANSSKREFKTSTSKKNLQQLFGFVNIIPSSRTWPEEQKWILTIVYKDFCCKNKIILWLGFFKKNQIRYIILENMIWLQAVVSSLRLLMEIMSNAKKL